MRRKTYLAHRWIALIVSLQLLAWSVGGFMFSILDINDVRGDLDKRTDPPPSISIERVAITPNTAQQAAIAHGIDPASIARMTLRDRFDTTVYELFDMNGKPLLAVDAATGEVVERVSEEQIKAVALADFIHPATITSFKLLEGEPPLEFRGGAMPVYQVILDHPKNPHLYISPTTGQVLKRRNRPWRIFDFFWMLHIMDYGQRDDFNHWLLTAMSVLAILTSVSGLALWAWRIPRRKRRRPKIAA